jgi:hypothetical protein
LRGSHSGPRIARIAIHILDRLAITVKVRGLYFHQPVDSVLTTIQAGHWTLDNAEMNATFMRALGEIMRAREIPFDPDDNRIMCFPHIINICTTHVFESFTDTALTDDQADFDAALPPMVPAEQTYEEACGRDPIALCRCTVWAIHASGLRRDHFHEIVSNGNTKGWFKSPEDPNETIKVPEVQLIHDVRTRWDSIYKMIHRFCELRPVSNC